MKPPEGYEVAPLGHVLRHGVDLIEAPFNPHIIDGKTPPPGTNWIEGLAGFEVSPSNFGQRFRPVTPNIMHLFYDQGERYTDDGLALMSQTDKLLRPLFQKWVKKGFSIRDIGSIMNSEVTDLTNEHILSKDING